MVGNKIDPAIERMIDDINKKGFKGKISPGLVQKIPRNELEPLVMEGLTDKEIAEKFDVSLTPINYLRKFYDMPGAREVKKMLDCVEDDVITKKPDETLNVSVSYKTTKEGVVIPEAVKGSVTVESKELVVDCVPLINIENEQACVVAPLLQGAAKYLERLDKKKVSVTVIVDYD